MVTLGRLPRLASTLNIRYTTPGHANPYFLDRARLIDPAHPAANLTIRKLPAFVSTQFTIRAFPHAILHEPEDFVPLNPLLATDRVRAHPRPNIPSGHGQDPDTRQHAKYLAARHLADARTALAARRGRHNLSLLFHTSKKATSKSSVVRRRLRSKMTAAIDLVLTRNADAVPASERDKPRPPNPYPPLHLVIRPPEVKEPLVHKGWTYLVIPDLTLYRMPLPNLVRAVRQALSSISRQSTRLEASWSAVLANPTPPPAQDHVVDRRRHRPHEEVVDRHTSAVRTQVHRPHRVRPFPRSVAEPVQGSDVPGQLAKHGLRTSARLYAAKPVVLPREKPKGKKGTSRSLGG